jgi:maltose-binding protein MalE
MGLIKIFSGEEMLAVGLKDKLEQSNITVVIRNNNQANVLPSVKNNKAVELFIQEIDYGKANPVIDEFRLLMQ